MEGIDRRDAGYYSTPNFVARFLQAEMCRYMPSGKLVFDPCVGNGELVQDFVRNGKEVVAFDIHDFGGHEGTSFQQRNFLEYYRDWRLCSESHTRYDYLVANPPYNCHEADYIRENKKWLGALFPEIGVGNMYSMFIGALIDIAKPGALIGLVTLDSFLTAGSHEALRRKIIGCCSILNLHLCPCGLFRSQKADVRTCIVILQKGKGEHTQTLCSNRPASVAAFEELLGERRFDQFAQADIVLDGDEDNAEIVIGCPPDIRALFSMPRLGAVFPCVTGISTGNDKEFISPTPSSRFSVPFFKNPAKRRFFTRPDGYLPNDFLKLPERFPTFMIRNKGYLFQEGITCSSMGVSFGCAHLPAGSTFGVNASIFPPKSDINWLIGYINSSLVTYFVRAVLMRGNMVTSGYVSRVPLVSLPLETRNEIGRISSEMIRDNLTDQETQAAIAAIDTLIFKRLDLSVSSQNEVCGFAGNVLQLT